MVDRNVEISAFRIIDASFNRAMEGLRVVEEFARMHLNDAGLSEQLKKTRHRLADLVSELESVNLLASRDIVHDVGTHVRTESEYRRNNLDSVVRANFARVLQSLRSIEEYGKLAAPQIADRIEQLRYTVYALEKAVVNVHSSQRVIGDAAIYVLLDIRGGAEEFEILVKELVDAKVEFIQLRDKRRDDRQLLEAGKTLSRLTGSGATRWIMNDRPDLAVLSGADGVHVGQTDLDLASVRRIVGPEKIVGVSTHNLKQAKQAVLEGANYIGVGPVFSSQTKSFDAFANEEFIQAVVAEIAIPAFAIGGITADNVAELLALGINRFAIGHAITDAASPATFVATFKKKILETMLPTSP